MSEGGTQSRVGIGVSSVLMVLVVLAMAALSVLAYSSTRATEAMTRRNVERTQACYQAAAQAEERLQAIDQAAWEKPPACEDELEWYQARAIPDVEWSLEAEKLCFVVTVPYGAGQAVVARGVMETEQKARYALLSFRTVSDEPTDETTNLNLMGV